MRHAGPARRAGSLSCVPALLCVLAVLAAASLVPAAEARGDQGLNRVEKRIVRLINAHRHAHGLRSVHADARLGHAADYHNWDMLRGRFFSHSSRNGMSSATRIRRFRRVRVVGETLAWMSARAAAQASRVVRMWMGSSPHRAVLLDGRFRRIGISRRIGFAGGGRVAVFTADFGSRR